MRNNNASSKAVVPEEPAGTPGAPRFYPTTGGVVVHMRTRIDSELWAATAVQTFLGVANYRIGPEH
jgi:hypothetical protein